MLDTDSTRITRSNSLSIVICSGGTGGHMFPACALFDSLKARGHSVCMITDVRGDRFCKTVAPTEKVVLPTLLFSPRGIFKLLRDFTTVYSYLRSLWKTSPPDLIVGFGGSFTIAPIFAGKSVRSRVVLYEQNSILGRANKFLVRFSDFKVSTFAVDERWKQLPPPVRKEFIEAAKTASTNPSAKYSYDGRIKMVIIGGSQGALSFSLIIPKALALIDLDLLKEIDIVQQVGDKKMGDLHETYAKIGVNARLLTFVHNIAEEMSEAQLIISRSGASTLAELSTLGRPAILIPYPLAADNHQYHNAVCYKNRKAAWIVEENEDAEKKLASIISNVLKNRQLLKNAASNMISGLRRSSTEIFSDYIEQIGFSSSN